MHERIVATLAVALLNLATLAPTVAAQEEPATATFRNYNRTFQIELPTGWRQIAPGEAVRVGEHPDAPSILRLAAPRNYYAIGPIDRWLEGDFSGPWLYVFEQRDEWHVDDDYADTLRELWRKHGEANGVEHELRGIHLEKLGTQQVECIVATRTTTPKPPARKRTTLDVHAPTHRQQITLSFAASTAAFDRWQPEFRKWLDSLTFARTAEPAQSLGERLWTPILTGAVVGLVLVLLYRYTRSRR